MNVRERKREAFTLILGESWPDPALYYIMCFIQGEAVVLPYFMCRVILYTTLCTGSCKRYEEYREYLSYD